MDKKESPNSCFKFAGAGGGGWGWGWSTGGRRVGRTVHPQKMKMIPLHSARSRTELHVRGRTEKHSS